MTSLELRGVSREFRGGGGVCALDLRVSGGEIVALIGLNGAGKTTLLRTALGMLRPHTGTVLIDDMPIQAVPQATWAHVGHLIEMPFAYPELTTRENLRVAALLHRATPTVEETIAQWRLDLYAGRRARRLSLGNRQRLGLAAALQHQPRVIVLDEPTNALDPAGVIILRDALIERSRAGAAVLVSSHHLDEVSRIADRIVVMNAGRLIGELPPHGVDLEHQFFELVRSDDELREEAVAR
ncbi:MAG: ABC transporter ATP-binding protein [Nocardiaceae bacterium]|nr:ABC transporter ATP-binding protein [Nocardiaceae bacterium]